MLPLIYKKPTFLNIYAFGSYKLSLETFLYAQASTKVKFSFTTSKTHRITIIEFYKVSESFGSKKDRHFNSTMFQNFMKIKVT